MSASSEALELFSISMVMYGVTNPSFPKAPSRPPRRAIPDARAIKKKKKKITDLGAHIHPKLRLGGRAGSSP